MAFVENAHSPRRPHQACLNCRRKKVRCPGEKPICSSCTRLRQKCRYGSTPKTPSSTRPVEDRLTHLEEQLNLILRGNGESSGANNEQSPNAIDEAIDLSILSGLDQSHQVEPNLVPSLLSITRALDLYFEHCHRQPIWCVDPEDVDDPRTLSSEFVSALLALTSRFAPEIEQTQLYQSNARRMIMGQIADGSVGLTTLESLCLLSYSYFLDGDFTLGQFHLGLAFQICRAARMDLASGYGLCSPETERKKRTFWSCQILEQAYGQQTGLLTISAEVWKPLFVPFSNNSRVHQSLQLDSAIPPPPTGSTGSYEIWSSSIHLGWIWSRIRRYVSDAAVHDMEEPWRHSSAYAIIISDLLAIENTMPMDHRYDAVKFYQRESQELNADLPYWRPWLKTQFLYHACHMVLNHPFLYIAASQQNPNLAIPNTFWRRSAELVLLHATWIVRMVDMASDKQVQLFDPFFAHAVAISATVHLYYCCANDSRLRNKSRMDFSKCRAFLKGFALYSANCATLETRLNELTRIATNSENMELVNWAPSKIYLRSHLMWDILDFNCGLRSRNTTVSDLLDSSLSVSTSQIDDDGPTFEIMVATSPEITVNTADGGQAAPVSSTTAVTSTATPNTSGITTIHNDVLVAPSESLRINSSWFWSDQPQSSSATENGYYDTSGPGVGDTIGSNFWDFTNF